MAKAITVGLWVLIGASFLVAFPSPYGQSLHAIGLILLVAHLAEYFIFRMAINNKKDGSVKAFLMTMIFGIFYIKG